MGPRRPIPVDLGDRNEPPEELAYFKKVLEERRKWRSPEEDALWERDERQKVFEATWEVNGEAAGKAAKCPGWIRVQPDGKPWAVTAGIRWFPELHPNGIAVEGDALRLFVVPEQARPPARVTRNCVSP